MKQVLFTTLQGQAYFELQSSSLSAQQNPVIDTRFIHASSLAPRPAPFDAQHVSELLEQYLTDTCIAESVVLYDYDNNYFARHSYRDNNPPLPVLRVKLNDPQQS